MAGAPPPNPLPVARDLIGTGSSPTPTEHTRLDRPLPRSLSSSIATGNVPYTARRMVNRHTHFPTPTPSSPYHASHTSPSQLQQHQQSNMIITRRKEPQAPPSPSIQTSPIAHHSTSLLLALPTELRLQICENLLMQGRGTRISGNVLRTCKQIYREGMPVLYGENTFLAHPSLLSALPSFLLGVRPSKIVASQPVKHERVLGMIRNYYLLVRLDTDPRFTTLQAREAFSGVASLELEVFQAMYGSCDFSVLKLFEGVRGVGKATVQGSVGDGRYARWLERRMESEEGAELEPFFEEYVAGVPSWHAWAQGNR